MGRDLQGAFGKTVKQGTALDPKIAAARVKGNTLFCFSYNL
jgi:hypothetical protein